MIIIAHDTAGGGSGVCVWQDKKPIHIESAVICRHGVTDHAKWASRMKKTGLYIQRLSAIYQEYMQKDDVVFAFETSMQNYQQKGKGGRNQVKVSYMLGLSQGAVMANALSLYPDVPSFFWEPGTWRKTLGFRRSFGDIKEHGMRYLSALFPSGWIENMLEGVADSLSHNVSDACLIAKATEVYIQYNYKEIQEQLSKRKSSFVVAGATLNAKDNTWKTYRNSIK